MGLRFLKSSLRRRHSSSMESTSINYTTSAKLKKFPWLKLRKNYDPGVIGLHQEIVDFYKYMRPSDAEYSMRNDVVDRVKNIITNRWPYAIVEVFGSFRTGLYLPTSDIDFVAIGKWARLPLHALRDELLKYKVAVIDSIQIIDKAAVPIIKFTDAKTQIQVDISFNIVNGIKSAELIVEYMKRYPILPPLIMVIKQFLNQRQLNEVFSGGLSSYSIILLTISFLQLHPRFTTMQAERFKNCNLGVLLIEFFELYGRHFNYDTTGIRVDPYVGSSYYPKRTYAQEQSWSGSTSMLSIQDPLLEGNDIAKSSFAFYRVRQAFEYAYVILVRAVNEVEDGCKPPEANGSRTGGVISDFGESLLGQIVSVPGQVRNYRKWVAAKFKSSSPSSDQVPPDPTSTNEISRPPFGLNHVTLSSSSHDSSISEGCSELSENSCKSYDILPNKAKGNPNEATTSSETESDETADSLAISHAPQTRQQSSALGLIEVPYKATNSFPQFQRKKCRPFHSSTKRRK